ncbi:MAG TPA: universal stress protein [Roseiflexaceae bacterium]
MDKILVPLDGSALAEQALPYAQLIAPLLDASVRLIRVISYADHQHLLASEQMMLAKGGPPPPLYVREQQAWKQLRTHAERYLAAQAALLRRAGVDVEAEVAVDLPAEAIVENAARGDCALIAMATHGYGGLSRWALGSIADKVVQAAPAPVLLVRAAAGGPAAAPALRRILVPLDGSALAEQALPLAATLAAETGAALLLLLVVEPSLGMELGMPPRLRPDQALSLLRDRLMREADRVVGGLDRGHVSMTPLVAEGHPAEAIVDIAAQRHADLIVMSTHGRSGLRRWALGSIADKVLHATTTPLILIGAQASAGRSWEPRPPEEHA